ncbi:MAG: ABC transporter ATP-binding protein [Treponema sp.]|jgi:oligopeptide/dipeptide ABC transporter ATP-binding protein|nr:ABC transporter ATP-binding protein [Treponema sp.]
MDNPESILSIEDLHTSFAVGKRKVKAVDGVSLEVRRGATLGLVGESGCGKSVTAHSIIQLLPRAGSIDSGRVIFRPRDGEAADLLAYKKTSRRLRAIRGKKISMIFQDPMSSLNPVYRIGDQIIENIRTHERVSVKEARQRVIQMLETLSIPRAADRIKDYPHQFSGGMKQRVMIAMGLICNPELLIADEPTTALDVTIQAQILELIQNLQRRFGFTVILITHNMGIVADVADDVAVMYMGKIVESGSKEDIFLRPSHPYTQALLRSVPVLGNGGKKLLEPIQGNTPDPSDLPPGCAFAPRCDYVQDDCSRQPPETNLGDRHMVRCFCRGGR